MGPVDFECAAAVGVPVGASDPVVVRLHPDDIAALATALAAALRPPTRKRAGTTPAEEAAATQWFRAWESAMGYEGRYALTGTRKAIALARIREGRTLAEWTQIVQWASTQPHLRGHNSSNRAYDDFDTLAASAAKFEKYLKASDRGTRATNHTADLFANTSSTDRRL